MKGSAVVVFVGLACALLASAPASGALTGEAYFGDQPPQFAFGIRGSWHNIDGITASSGSYFGGNLGFDTDFGYGLSAEYWLTPSLSLELAFDHVKIEDTFGANRTVALGLNDWALSAKLTLPAGTRLRPYVFAGGDWFTSSLNLGGTGTLLVNGDVNSTWGWHVGGGLEYRFTDNLGLFAEVRYRNAEETDIEVTQWFSGIPAATSKDTVEYDGLVATIGIKIYW